MARQSANKKSGKKANARKKPADTTVAIPLSFDDAVAAFLKTAPPSKKKSRRR